MKRKTVLLLLVACGLVLSGCKFHRGIAGSGVRKTEKRDLKSFNAIDTTGAYEIDATCQRPASFEIEADDNILPLIKTEVRDGILFVSNDQVYNSAKAVSLRFRTAPVTQRQRWSAQPDALRNIDVDFVAIAHRRERRRA